MPKPRAFAEDAHPSEYSFELLRKGGLLAALGSSALLMSKFGEVARITFGLKPEVHFRPGSSWHGLGVENARVQRFSTGESTLQCLTGFDLGIGQGEPLVAVDVAHSSARMWPRPSRYGLRVWRHGAGRAVFDSHDRLILTTHNAWRDSEAARHMIEGYRLEVNPEADEAVLAVLSAALTLGNDIAAFDYLERGS